MTTEPSGTLTITAGQSSATISVSIIDDADTEGAETFTVTLSNPSGATLESGAVSATVTISASDAVSVPEVGFASASAAVGEDGGSVSLTVELSAVSGSDVTVAWAASGGTATAGSDYGASGTASEPSGTLTITAGQSSATISVSIIDDADTEGAETFTVTLSNPSGATLESGAVSATVTISASDAVSVPEVGFASVPAVEWSMTFVVRLSAPSGSDVTVAYETADGSARAGEDFRATAGRLVIPAGETRATLRVPLIDDRAVEDPEEFLLLLSDPRGVELGPPAAAPGRILDDDTPARGGEAAPPSLAVSAGRALEGAGRVMFGVSLSAPAPTHVTVDYRTADGSARAGADYRATVGRLGIPAGAMSATLIVPIIDDEVAEGPEEFVLELLDPSGAVLGEERSATASISDDDAPRPAVAAGAPVLALAGSRSPEAARSVTFTVSLRAPSGGDVSVAWETVDGTARAGEDYVAASGRLVIPAGATEAKVPVVVLDDERAEGDRTLGLVLSDPAGATLPAVPRRTGVIVDDDAPRVVGVPDALESDGSVTFEVWLDEAAVADVPVRYRTTDGSAVAGADYEEAGGTLVIPAGALSGTVEVRLLDDSLDEVTETFGLELLDGAGASPAGWASAVRISDDDAPPALGSVAAVTVAESDTAAQFTLRLDGPSGADVWVGYEIRSGTATAGDDFRASSGWQAIPAGRTTATISVPLVDDAVAEDAETFSLRLLAAAGAALPAITTATATIRDDDSGARAAGRAATPGAPAEPVITVADAVADESDRHIIWTVRLDRPSSSHTDLIWSIEGVTATAGSDYRATSGRLRIAAGATSAAVGAALLDDTRHEPPETLTLRLTGPDGTTLTATGTIRDDDRPPTVHVAAATAPESRPPES